MSLEKQNEMSRESIGKRSKKQYYILHNVNLMRLTLKKLLSLRFSNDFYGKKKKDLVLNL